MRTNPFVVVLLGVGVLACMSCDKQDKIVGGGPTAPSTTINVPLTTVPSLGSRVELKDDNSGDPINVGVNLQSMDRVSALGCPTNGCVKFTVMLDVGHMTNPNVVVDIKCGFSNNGKDLASIFQGDNASGQCSTSLRPDSAVPMNRQIGVDPVPPYLLVSATYPADTVNGVVTRPGGSGKVAFAINSQ